MKTIENAANKWTDAEYAFAAAYRVIDAWSENEGYIPADVVGDYVRVLRHAAELELPGADELLAFWQKR